jgi:hypothetical protein
MTDIDELDRIWREGLASAAATMAPVTDPNLRVVERVRRRRRTRITFRGIGVVVTGLTIVLAVLFARNPPHADFATSSPVTVVRVEVLVHGQLTIQFPGRAVHGQPPHVELPQGLIRFDVSSPGGSDRLVIDGVPTFVAVVVPPHHAAVTETVQISPGTYLMHSTLAGHAAVGEEAILIVR